MEASTTNKLSVPYTFVSRSTTDLPPVLPSSVPIEQVPVQWFEPRDPGVAGICGRSLGQWIFMFSVPSITHRVNKCSRVLVRRRSNPGQVRDLTQDASHILNALDHSFFIACITKIRRCQDPSVHVRLDGHSASRRRAGAEVLSNCHGS